MPHVLGVDDATSIHSPFGALIALKASLRRDGTARAAAAARQELRELAFAEGAGRLAIGACGQWSPALQNNAGDYVAFAPPAVAAVRLHCLEWSSPALLRRARDALAGSNSVEHAVFMRCFEQEWARMHETIDFHPLPAVFDAAVPTTEPVCMMAGCCLCNAAGVRLRRFVGSLHAMVKAEHPRKSQDITSLLNGHTVLLLMGQPRAAAADIANDALWADALLPGVPIAHAVWVHTAFVLQSPWKIIFHKMAGPDVGAGDAAAPDAALVTATGVFQTQWQLASSFDLEATRWVACSFLVDFHLRPLAHFCPMQVALKKAGRGIKLIWCPWGKPPRKKKAAAEEEGWGPVIEAEEAACRSEGHDEASAEGESCDSGAEADDLDAEGEAIVRDLCAPESPGADEPAGILAAEADILHEEAGPTVDAEDEIAVAELIEVVIGVAPPAVPMGTKGDEEPPLPPPAGPPELVPALPEPAADPAPPEMLAALGPGGAAGNVRVDVEFGKITWYSYSGDFVAVCNCPVKCRKHRTSKRRAGKAGSGRPLGFLMAWLEVCCPVRNAYPVDEPTLEDREAGRASLMTCHGAEELFIRERLQEDGEAEEPLVFT